MKKALPAFLAILSLVVLPALAISQARTAHLVGYEKAEFVAGQVNINPDGTEVLISGLQSSYTQTLVVYIAKAFDFQKSTLVGEIPAGWTGDMTFELPSLDFEGMDSVLVMVPGWTVPVAVGLLN